MKRISMLLALVATLAGNSAFAQQSNGNGRGAAASRNAASNEFAWGIAVGGLVVLGTVVGVVAGTSASAPTTHSH